MNNDTIELLKRIDQSLERMRNEGAEEEGCIYYNRLKDKRDAIANGHNYEVKTFSPIHMIAYIGSHIPDINTNSKGEIIKNKQNKKMKTVEALTSLDVHIDDDMMNHYNELDNIISGVNEYIKG